MSKAHTQAVSGGASEYTTKREYAIELIKICATNLPKIDMFGKLVSTENISTKLSFKQNDRTGGLDVVVARKEGKDPSKPSTNTKRLVQYLPKFVEENGGKNFGKVSTGAKGGKLSNTIILTIQQVAILSDIYKKGLEAGAATQAAQQAELDKEFLVNKKYLVNPKIKESLTAALGVAYNADFLELVNPALNEAGDDKAELQKYLVPVLAYFTP